MRGMIWFMIGIGVGLAISAKLDEPSIPRPKIQKPERPKVERIERIPRPNGIFNLPKDKDA